MQITGTDLSLVSLPVPRLTRHPITTSAVWCSYVAMQIQFAFREYLRVCAIRPEL